MDKIMIPLETSSEALELSHNILNADDFTNDDGIRTERRGASSLQGCTGEGSPSMNKIRKNRRDDKIPFS